MTVPRAVGQTSCSASFDVYSKPVALVLPGMGLRAHYYGSFTKALVDAGMDALAVDLRGQTATGPAPSRATDHGFYELSTIDTADAVRRLQNDHPGSPILLVGHSLGGHVATLYAATNPKSLAGLVTIAADSPYYRAHGSRGPATLASAQLAAGISRMIGFFPGGLPGLGGLGRQPRRLMTEWARLGRTGRYEIDRLPGVEAAIAAAPLPVLAVSIEGDRVAPPASIDHVVDKMRSATVERWHYTPAAAGCARLTHANWAKFSSALAKHVARWWQDVAASHSPASNQAPVVRQVVQRF